MKRRVELVYDAGCPHVGLSRSALVEAFARQGLQARWVEWERGDPEAPDYVRSCGSPTVLIDGHDVAPSVPTEGEGCCRLYETPREGWRGSPPADMMAAALGPGAGRSRWPAMGAALPGALAAALPTCPFCWPLYAGAFGAPGLGFLLDEQHFLWLATLLLLLTLAPLGYRAATGHGYGTLLVGGVGAGLVLLGKFVWASGFAVYLGLAAILGASLWSAWPKDARRCSRCENA